MNPRIKHTLLATLVAAGISIPATCLGAVINSPYAQASVTIGEVQGDGGVWACFSDMNGSGFTWFKLGGSAGLDANYAIHGGSSSGQGDWITIVRSVAPVSTTLVNICGGPWTLHAPKYNGHFIDLYGGTGSDRIESGLGDTWLWGEDDGDDLETLCSGCQVDGGPGGDLIHTMSTSSSSEAIFGESGADCFYDETTSWSTLNGGSGTDIYYSTSMSLPAHTTSVESTSKAAGKTRCPSPFFG